MRLASIEKMGYYPTPDLTLKRISNFLEPDRKGVIRLLDPCAGYGIAIASVAQELREQGANVESYGVELSHERAPRMRMVVDKGIAGAWEDVSMTQQMLGLLYLNPPYDYEASNGSSAQRKHRLEYLFLQSTISKLAYGGVLVYIVPLHIIQNRHYAGYLGNNFHSMSVYRLPQGEYDPFKQVVLFGIRRSSKDVSERQFLPTFEDVLPPELPATPDTTYIVPVVRLNSITFRLEILERDEVVARVRASGAQTTRQFLQLTEARDDSMFQPVVKMKIGHVAGMISSGQMGVVKLGDVLAKGRTSKKIDVITKSEDDEGNKVILERDRFVTTVTTITRDGQIRTIDKQEEMESFLDEYGVEISEIVSEKYTPLYTGPTVEEWKKLSPLMKKKHLKGRKESGLFDAQKHCAVAMLRSLKKIGWVNLVGEMGTGKTATSLAASVLLTEQWPIIVMCPGTLVDKWAAEATSVIPGAKGFVINSLEDMVKFHQNYNPGVKKPKAPRALIEHAPRHLQPPVEPDEWLVPPDKWVAVISKDRAKLGPGWKHAFNTKTVKFAHQLANGTIVEVKAEVVTCPKCGKAVRDKKGEYILAHRAEHHGPGAVQDPNELSAAGDKRLVCNNPKPRWKGDPHDNSVGKKIIKDQEGEILTCGEQLWRVDSSRQWVSADTDPTHVGGHRLWSEQGEWRNSGIRRWPVAEYVHDKMNGFFKLFIADEVHEYRGKDSDQAGAYHSLRDSVKYVANLTGTIFNGKSTSLFWMLYRNDKNIRRVFDFNSENAWALTYGRLERTKTTNDNPDEEDGQYGLKGKNRNKAKEIPGISPGIFALLLPNTIFLKKADLGFTLPPYQEEIVRVDMGREQEKQYNWMYNTLFKKVMDGLKSRDKYMMAESTRLMSVWLQRSLGRPDTAFRREMVMWKFYEGKGDDMHRPFLTHDFMDEITEPDRDHSFVMENDPDFSTADLFSEDEYLRWKEYEEESETGGYMMYLDRVIDQDCLLPKEAQMAETAVAEVRAGHKVLIYVNQTGTNDIQQRLATVIEGSGLRATILPKNIKPQNRAAWIEKNYMNMDVLICNPKAIETGLDLVMFSRILVSETIVNLLTLQQSLARIYRLGQIKDTKVYFFVYRNTMEEGFLSLIAQKIKAASLLYGDNAASAIAEDDGNEQGLREELISRLMAGKKIIDDGLGSIMSPFIENDIVDAWGGYEAPEEEEHEEAYVPEFVPVLSTLHEQIPEPEELPVVRDVMMAVALVNEVRKSWNEWRDEKVAELKANGVVIPQAPKQRKVKVVEEQMALFS